MNPTIATILGVVIWFLAGLAGSYLIWVDYLRIFKKPPCPTPKAILGILIGSFLGGVILIVGLFATFASFLEGDIGSAWWSTPLCKKPENKK